jgi:hypothetical protein
MENNAKRGEDANGDDEWLHGGGVLVGSGL